MILAHKDVNADALKLLSSIAHVESAPLETEDELIRKLKGKRVLVVRSKPKVTRRVFASCPGLKLVVRLGVGLDNIDAAAAKEFGVKLANTPGATTESVAEHTIALALSLLRNIHHAHASMKRKAWERHKFQGFELSGRAWGIIGFGRIGKRVADILKAFGARVIVFDPYVPDPAPFQRFTGLHAFLSESDIVSIHVPLTPETKNLISKKELDCLKGGYIINTSRGGIINEADLFNALSSGVLAGAALDVFENEPPSDSPLLSLDNIILTPHLGGSTEEGQERAVIEAVERIREELNL